MASIFAVGFMGGVVGALACLIAAQLLRPEGVLPARQQQSMPQRPAPPALTPQQQGFIGRLLRPAPMPVVSDEEREEAAREAKLRAWRLRLAARPDASGWMLDWDADTSRYVVHRTHPGAPSEPDVIPFPSEAALESFIRGAG